MADVKNVITLGIGSSPGSIKFFILVGLDVNPHTAPRAITANPKAGRITAYAKVDAITADEREGRITACDKVGAITANEKVGRITAN